MPSWPRLRVYRDGSAMAALVGDDLQGGEAEWAVIEKPGGPKEQRAAGEAALRQLLARLPQHAKTPVEWVQYVR